MKKIIQKGFNCLGLEIMRKRKILPSKVPHDLDKDFSDLFSEHKKTLGDFSIKLYTTYKAVEYIVKNKIEGDFVECGVFEGRHIALMALTLKKFGDTKRNIYLYDTFAGMTKPGENDIKTHREHLNTAEKNIKRWEEMQKNEANLRCYGPIEKVKANVYPTNYPEEKFHFVVGDVLKTIPNNHHKEIAFLRLDTDWYESTKHELIHLYKFIVNKGIICSDDYGSWAGARKAMEEFFQLENIHPFLCRTEPSERVFIKE